MNQLDEASRELHQHLNRTIQGEVRFDPLHRQLYGTDASCYRIVPAGVVIPRSAEDVQAVVEAANLYQATLVPRGGGSSLSGQAIGPGLVVDCSRWLDKVITINPEESWVEVEAGLTLDQLNLALQDYGLMVGPNPASGAVATLGGMAANNSTGSHSIRYGLMIDHVLQMEVVLSDGGRCTLGPKTADEVAALAQQPGLEGGLYRQVPVLLEQYRGDIATGYPRTWRNVAGYTLNRLLSDQAAGRPLNLASLVVGSEGTLAVILSLRLHVVPLPKVTHLTVLHFADMQHALEQVPWILEHEPSAVELISHIIIRQARLHPAFRSRLERFISGNPQAVLVVEFSGDQGEALAAQAKELERRFRQQGCRGVVIHCSSPETIENVWGVRRDVNGLLLSQPGDKRPLSIVDDAAVPLDQLAQYAKEVKAACREAGAEVSFDGHASAGCLHMNPAVNLKTPGGLRQMQAISQAVMEISMRHDGTTTGEHGEGLARSHYNEQLYGPRLHQAFRQVKALFDPGNCLNPGKIIDAPLPWQPELLRFNPEYRTPLAPSPTYFEYAQFSSFAGLVEMCNGQGLCRSLGSGVMCPSYRATRDEMHSTRGRANALRAAMTGELGPEGMTSRELHEALDLCLECKACKRECSSLVDMARLKSEFLANYQAHHGIPLRSRIFAHIASLNRLASWVPALSNRAFRNPLIRSLLDNVLGIDQRRTLPLITRHTFRNWFKSHPGPASSPNGPVILWDDTYLTYNEPAIGIAAVRVLEAAGYEIRLVEDRLCCGRPMISKGLLREARQNAAHNIARLAPLAAQGIPIVGLEPSCIATFRDEYPALLPGEAARQVAENSFFIEEFLTRAVRQGKNPLPLASSDETHHILVHGHCYQKALASTSPLLEMLRLVPGVLVEEIPSGCCGMAGAFGYEKEHYQLSMSCGEESLFPAIRASSNKTIIAAAGVSCRQQIWDGTGRRAIHPVQVLADVLDAQLEQPV
jgi:FAD/FMN-containing dehydrogenase/Fe-S oxidoreductase